MTKRIQFSAHVANELQLSDPHLDVVSLGDMGDHLIGRPVTTMLASVNRTYPVCIR